MKTILIPGTLSGRVRLKGHKRDGTVRLIHDWCDNIILNIGLEMIASTANYLDWCHVGLSDTEPAANQTTLLDWVGSTNTRTAANSITTTEAPFFGISQISYLFDEGAIVGNIKELGFGPLGTEGSSLFNRALVTDSFGNASFAVVLADEALEVEYELTIAAPTEDIEGTLSYDGDDYAYVIRPALVTQTAKWCPYRSGSYASAGQAVQAVFTATELNGNVVAYDGAIGTEELQPSGASSPARYFYEHPYVADSHQKLLRCEWSLEDANFGTGIRSILWFMKTGTGSGGNSLGAYQIEFTPPIPKDDQNGFRINLGMSWGNAE